MDTHTERGTCEREPEKAPRVTFERLHILYISFGCNPFSLVHRTENIVGKKHLGNFESSQTTTRLSGGLSFAKLRKLVLFKLSCRKSLKVLGETIAFRAHSR